MFLTRRKSSNYTFNEIDSLVWFLIWCDFWSGGIICPCFFRNEAGRTVIVNGKRYRSMITKFLGPQLEEVDVNNIWCQQDFVSPSTCNNRSIAKKVWRFDYFKHMWHWKASQKMWFGTVRLRLVGLFAVIGLQQKT